MTVEEIIRALAMHPYYSEVEVIHNGKSISIKEAYCDGDYIVIIPEGEKYIDPWDCED